MNDKDATQTLIKQTTLIYINGDEPGYTRKKCGRGFAYYTPDGVHIKDKALKTRFNQLAIPPAWQGVWICMDENGHIQSTGRDDKQRKQYLYHPLWREIRDHEKFTNLLTFGQCLGNIRAQVQRDMQTKVSSTDTLTANKLTATIVYLLDKSLIRIGNDYYAKQNQSYGLTTLREKHIDIRGDTVEFDFTGKSGVEHHLSLKDKKLAEILHHCQDIPGYRLFECIEDGEKITIDSGRVNDYLHAASQANISAKDFRTWGASVEALEACYEAQQAATSIELATDNWYEDSIREVVKRVAKSLGNTPAVCRQSYIHPAVFSEFKANKLAEHVKQVRSGKWLDRSERALLALLENTSNQTINNTI